MEVKTITAGVLKVAYHDYGPADLLRFTPSTDVPGKAAECLGLTQAVSKRRRIARKVISAHSSKFRC